MPAKKAATETVDPKDRRIDGLVKANETKDAEIRRIRRELGATSQENERLAKELDLIRHIESVTHSPELIKLPPKRNGKPQWHATPIFVSSDLQAGEVVKAEALHGFNAYDNAIARLRFRHTAESVVLMTRDGMPQYAYDGIVVVLNGDPISNNIHEELQETNQGTVLETVDFAIDEHIAMLDLFLKAFPKVHVVATPSNHGRFHKKTPHKEQARNSFDWLIAKVLKRHFRGNDRITFHISDAADAQFKVYETTFHCEHGHTIKGYGDGVAGIAPAMARATMKRRNRDLAMGRPADYYIYSHFHQLTHGTNWTLNGSYVGYTEYPYDLALGVQKPQQALLMAVPRRGISLTVGIDCEAPGERKLWPTAGRNSW